MAIKINPKNKGKFNALKKRTGKTTEQLTHSKNPLTRKRAIFAQNAKKWKHEFGGELPFDLAQSFAQMNNLPQKGLLSSGLAPTNNPGGKDSGLSLGLNPISMGLQALTAIGGAVGANMATKRNEMYSDAAEGMRQVDVGQATKGAGLQAFLQNPLTLGIGGKKKAQIEAEEFNETIAKQQRNKDITSRFSTMSEAPTYTPVARQGGFIAYKGQTHNDPSGGILVDKMGNPTGVSNGESVGLVEGGGKNKKGEVSYYEPESGSTYIYSDALGFGRPANSLLNKYKLNKPESLQYQQYKNDLLTQTMVKKKFDNLRIANEFAKETGSSAKDSIGIFKSGGELSSSKAKEMLRDGTAHGKKLTPKQKRYFGWIAGGRKEDGGELVNILDKRTIDMVTGKPLSDRNRMHANVDSDYVKLVRDNALQHGIDPYTALAINLQESGFRPNKPGEMNNPFRVLPNSSMSIEDFGELNTNPVGYSIKYMADKFKYAKRLGKKDEESILQAWNGYGKVGKNTEGRQEKMYGLDLPIDMSANPVYGKRIVNLRDSVIKTNPKLREIVESKKHGGLLPKYQDGDELDEPRIEPPYRQFPGYPENSLTNVMAPWYLQTYNPTGKMSGYSLPSKPKNDYNFWDTISQMSPTGIHGNQYKWKDQPTKPETKPTLTDWRYHGAPLHKSEIPQAKTGIGKPTITKQTLDRVGYPKFNMPDFYTNSQEVVKTPLYQPDGGDVQITLNKLKGEGSQNPWLSPLGHVLSGAGALADYAAMKKARPDNVSLGRVGAERISLAKQRLANTRNASAARSMAGSAARSSGMNAGVALSNTLAANTGANRLLGQQNAELLEREETANAQMRQQANMVNAELGAQEGMFNTQTQNAYRMMMAQRNPLGNLARTAASYFADNAAYGQQYDTLQMLAPNAELYRNPGNRTLNFLTGRSTGVRLRDKTL